ncbi:alpha/beta fold hydrolase [Zhihengliuella salsuginis]|uniref:Alpha/beta hydrolase fold protein n=1 Tax=Zhihengliuella salsuginis TaxID=578222 RepID=A0ABQ3GB57_9MICC|nr:alpha/beta hydrolase [Zhihengliuella salsuginis]GHD00076.1 alpha/beta hydrolase fold protein [Zhihengliuella salsuginis]
MGDGAPWEEPLVLLPGMSCSRRLWEGVEDELRSASGHSEILAEPLRGATLEECVSGLLRRLPDRFALAGLSLGGIVAMAMARTAPERISRLCLMSTNSHAPTPAQVEFWRDSSHRLAAGRTARDLQRDLLPVLLSDGARTEELDSSVLQMADEVGDRELADQLALQESRVDERAGLTRVEVPTRIIAGELDALCPVSRHEEMHELIPGSRLAVLPKRGHLTPMEDPAAVAEQIDDWMREIR